MDNESRAQLQVRCTSYKKQGLHNEPCNSTREKLLALAKRIEREKAAIQTAPVKEKDTDIQAQTSEPKTSIRPWDALEFPEEPSAVEYWSPAKSSLPVPIDTTVPDNEDACQLRIQSYDKQFYDWLLALRIQLEETYLWSWCSIYSELIKISNNATDEDVLYALVDQEIEDLLLLIDNEEIGYNFADRAPTLIDLFVRADVLSAKGYLVAHDELALVSSQEVGELLPYITTVDTAKKLYDFNKKTKIENRAYPTGKQLENAIRQQEGHLAKRGMLLFLTQFETMIIKEKTILQALYDYVVGHESFMEEILKLNNIRDWGVLLFIAARRNAPRALDILIHSDRIDKNSSLTYLLTEASSYGLVENVNVLLADKRVDMTNNGTYDAFLAAARRGNEEIFDILHPKYPPYQERPKLPLIPGLRVAAVEGGNLSILRRVLRFPSEDDDEALSRAVVSLNVEMVRLLLDDPNTIIAWGADAMLQLLNKNVEDEVKAELLLLLLPVKNMPLPLDNNKFLDFVSTHGVALLVALFKRRRIPADIIRTMRDMAEDVGFAEYNYLLDLGEQ